MAKKQSAEDQLLELKSSTIRTVKDVETEYKGYVRRVEEVQGSIRLWKSRGWFEKNFIDGGGSEGGGPGSKRELTGAYNESRAIAREAVQLGKRILRNIERIERDPAVKKDSEKKQKLNRIRRDLAKSVPPIEKMALENNFFLFARRKKPAFILGVTLLTLSVIGTIIAAVIDPRVLTGSR